MDWQPINSAPKDGSEFLTYAPGNKRAMYERDREPVIVLTKWKADCFWRNRPDNMPTHWMPLPEPPKGDHA